MIEVKYTDNDDWQRTTYATINHVPKEWRKLYRCRDENWCYPRGGIAKTRRVKIEAVADDGPANEDGEDSSVYRIRLVLAREQRDRALSMLRRLVNAADDLHGDDWIDTSEAKEFLDESRPWT